MLLVDEMLSNKLSRIKTLAVKTIKPGLKFVFCVIRLFILRQDLSWRDVQHIIVRTARPGPVKISNWNTNKAGLKGMCFVKL